jgi:hypothetical protein
LLVVIEAVESVKHIQRIRAEEGSCVVTYPAAENSKGDFALFSEQRMTDVSSRKTFLHLRGAVEYEDIFGDRHLTPFGYMWDADHHSVDSSWGEEPDPRWMEVVNSNDSKEA